MQKRWRNRFVINSRHRIGEALRKQAKNNREQRRSSGRSPKSHFRRGVAKVRHQHAMRRKDRLEFTSNEKMFLSSRGLNRLGARILWESGSTEVHKLWLDQLLTPWETPLFARSPTQNAKGSLFLGLQPKLQQADRWQVEWSKMSEAM